MKNLYTKSKHKFSVIAFERSTIIFYIFYIVSSALRLGTKYLMQGILHRSPNYALAVCRRQPMWKLTGVVCRRQRTCKAGRHNASSATAGDYLKEILMMPLFMYLIAADISNQSKTIIAAITKRDYINTPPHM